MHKSALGSLRHSVARQTVRLSISKSQLCRHPSRLITIQATPAAAANTAADADAAVGSLDAPSLTTSPDAGPDARFEVLGSTSSLLSVSLSASQQLFTRRGTLVGVSGAVENAVSSLSPLPPLLRGPLGIPFLYQKVSSSTPLNLLVATRSPHTSFSVVHLDGRVDWTVTQRNGLLAWTGHTLTVKPSLNAKMSIAHWGNSVVTGRGLVALAASGNTFQINLKKNEQYVAHPSNILAYSVNEFVPQPFRFTASTLRLQIPDFSSILPNFQFIRVLRDTKTYRNLAYATHVLRTWTRRAIWGDRLFIRFQGPMTVLLQSRGSRIRDVLSSRDANDVANAEPGVATPLPAIKIRTSDAGSSPLPTNTEMSRATKLTYARVNSGKVNFEKQ